MLYYWTSILCTCIRIKELQVEREETLEKLENLTSERNQLKQTCKVSTTSDGAACSTHALSDLVFVGLP